MTDKFEIGEVAIYVRPGSPCFGRECTILGKAGFLNSPDFLTGTINEPFFGYQISLGKIDPINNEDVWAARPEWLQKKQRRLDRECDRKVSWDECLWKPKQVTA
jgi:hypothetical protein